MHKVSNRKRNVSIAGRTPMESLQMLQKREKGVAEQLHEDRQKLADSGVPAGQTVSSSNKGTGAASLAADLRSSASDRHRLSGTAGSTSNSIVARMVTTTTTENKLTASGSGGGNTPGSGLPPRSPLTKGPRGSKGGDGGGGDFTAAAQVVHRGRSGFVASPLRTGVSSAGSPIRPGSQQEGGGGSKHPSPLGSGVLPDIYRSPHPPSSGASPAASGGKQLLLLGTATAAPNTPLDGRVVRKASSKLDSTPESPLGGGGGGGGGMFNISQSPHTGSFPSIHKQSGLHQQQLVHVDPRATAGGVVLAPKVHENAGREPASYSTFSSLEGAKIRRQLFTLCQQLFRGSNVQMDIEVREQGNTIWQSSNWDEDEPIVQVDVLDDDIQEIQRRSRTAFHKTVDAYNKKLKQHQHEIQKLRQDMASKEQGGSRYAHLQNDLESARFESKKQQAKIKSLVKLLDRAAGQLKTQEEVRENEQQARLAGETELDWLGVQAVVKDLVVEDREDHAVLRDVASFIEETTTRLNAVEVENEILSEKCAEKDAIAEAFKRERDSTALNNMKLSHENVRLTQEGEELRAEVGDLAKQLEKTKADAEQERNKLHAMLSNQELAMRNAVESKAHFIGQGKSAAVQPFLRFEGKVRNLEMPKKELEQLIVHIWATREEVTTKLTKAPSLSAIDRRAEKSLTTHLNAAHHRSVELAQLNTSQGGGGHSIQIGEGGGTPRENTDSNTCDTGGVGSPIGMPSLAADNHTSSMLMAADSPGSGGVGAPRRSSTTTPTTATTLFLGAFTCCGGFLVDYGNDALWITKGAAALRATPDIGPGGTSTSNNPRSSKVRASFSTSVVATGSLSPLSLPDHITRFVIENYCQDRSSVLMPSYTAWMNGLMPPNRHAQVDFLLKRATPLPSVAAEVSYSLLDGCERYKYDADVELFRRILKKEISESAFFDQMIMIQKLRFGLVARSWAIEKQRMAEEEQRDLIVATGGADSSSPSSTKQQQVPLLFPPSTTLPDPELNPGQLLSSHGDSANLGVDEVMKVCYTFFPAKPPESFPLLRAALEVDVRTPMAAKGKFSIFKLFASNEFGNQGAFVEAVRDQHLDEVCMHVAEVADAISGSGSRPISQPSGRTLSGLSPELSPSPPRSEMATPTTGSQRRQSVITGAVAVTGVPLEEGEATLATIRSALAELDPSKPMQDINKFLIELLEFDSQQQHHQSLASSGAPSSLRRESKRGSTVEPPAMPVSSPPTAAIFSSSPEDMFNLNSVVDCADLARLSKQVFCKRCGRQASGRTSMAERGGSRGGRSSMSSVNLTPRGADRPPLHLDTTK